MRAAVCLRGLLLVGLLQCGAALPRLGSLPVVPGHVLLPEDPPPETPCELLCRASGSRVCPCQHTYGRQLGAGGQLQLPWPRKHTLHLIQLLLTDPKQLPQYCLQIGYDCIHPLCPCPRTTSKSASTPPSWQPATSTHSNLASTQKDTSSFSSAQPPAPTPTKFQQSTTRKPAPSPAPDNPSSPKTNAPQPPTLKPPATSTSKPHSQAPTSAVHSSSKPPSVPTTAPPEPSPSPPTTLPSTTATPDKDLICHILCEQGQGGSFCNCMKPPAVTLPSVSSIKHTACYSLCAIGHGDGICTCMSEQASMNAPLPVRQVLASARLATSAPPHGSGDGEDHHNENNPADTEPDWDVICLELCAIGDGGLLCHCDLPPMAV